MPDVKTFDPAEVLLVVGGVPISGFAPGTFIRAERNEDAFNDAVGADGEGIRVKSNNKSGIVTITLLQSSESNDILSGQAQLDELSNTGIAPLFCKDNGGRTVISGPTAWVRRKAAVEFATTPTNREWVIATNELELFVGGN